MRRTRKGRALRRRYGRAIGSGRALNVVRRGSGWVITGLASGEMPLYFHLPYPQTEWPEIGSIKGAESMLSALYDAWQTSDELEEEKELRGGDLVFHTPYGNFETIGVHVVPAEDAPKARVAHEAYEARSAEIQRVENEVMTSKGFSPARMDEIYATYGSEFKNWPPGLSEEWWKAYHAAEHATASLRAALRTS